ncbi:13208_t:CDS:1 [Dentiscutata heterogama]|uniref:13208_t:CDS:1 n=1 Tax=Dentiscutata heterogama TaxID=1316150 RepID=A0ACA9K0H0_9GLOM|nr:13208_t:CDS:1 [Dentiscutata heterogama]
MEHVRSLLEKRIEKCPNEICRCEKKLEVREYCENCKNRLKCDIEAPLICSDCLHEVLEREFNNWSSGNLLIDEFIQKAQQSLSYVRYPEWIPYSFFTEIKCIDRGEFGAIFSAKWIQGAKIFDNDNDERYYSRSSPCAIILKKLKDMKHLEQFLPTKEELHDQTYYCCLYGITQDPSTLEYMLVEPTSVCDRCFYRIIESEFSNWTSGNLQIDRFIQEAQLSSSYIQYPEWIPYNSLSEIKFISKGGFGAVYSAKWDKGIKYFSIVDGDKYYTRSEPCTVALKQLEGENDTIHLFLREIQAQFNCCHLYGVTKDPSTSQYMFVMRYAPQGDLRRFLQRNFNKLTLENKLSIAQSICIELKNIHAKGWVHGDLHGGNILLLNEDDAFISDFGLCRPVNETRMLDQKIYGVIPNIAPEILSFQSPYSQSGDIYSLGIILWELVCGIPAFSNRAHDVNFIADICNGLRPKTCHFAPLTYNDLLRRCWDQNPLERPTINEILDSIQLLCTCFRYNCLHYCYSDKEFHHYQTQKKFKFLALSGFLEELTLDEYQNQDNRNKRYYKNTQGENVWLWEWDGTNLSRELLNSHNATKIYNIMKWKPDNPIHKDAVYKSRMISISNGYMARQNSKSFQYEISDIPYMSL